MLSISVIFQPIPYPWFIHEKSRAGGIRFKLVPELGHVNAQILDLIYVRGTPYFLQKLAVGNDLAGMAEQDDYFSVRETGSQMKVHQRGLCRNKRVPVEI